ncbi:MAG: aspartyl protease family protein [Hyphomonadaceae bacterium]|nr:aspartyl protease family protein [Hyphomonadaceae bacterium]
MIALRLIFALAASVLLQAPHTHAQAPTEAVEDGGGESVVDAVSSESARMLVSVTIDGAGPFPFIVDTGSVRYVVARDLAEQLNLQPAGRVRMVSMTAARELASVHVPNLSFIEGRVSTLQAFTVSRNHLGAMGILGIDALRGQRVVLDFAAQQVRVGAAPRRIEPMTPNEIVVRARARFGQLVLVDSDVAGTPVDVIVDSGLEVSIGNDALRRLLTDRHNEFEEIGLVSVTGDHFTADYTRVDRLRIGGMAISGLPVAFANPYVFRHLRLTNRPALFLGMDALRQFERVTVDFRNRRASFVLTEEGG